MRKGFVYTILFTALFLVLLMIARIYLLSEGSMGLSKAEKGSVDSAGLVMADLSLDLLHFFDLRIESKTLPAASRVNLTFHNTIPSDLAYPGTEFGEWTAFVENDFSEKTNLNISMNYVDFQLHPTIVVSPYNITYGYSALDRRRLVINGSSAITNYSIVMRLSRNINETNASNWSWSATPTSLFIAFDIEDSEGERILINGQEAGYIDPSVYSSFTLSGTPSGRMVVEAGSLPGYGSHSLAFNASDLRARLDTTLLLNGTDGVTVFAPIWVAVNEQQSNLVLFRG